MQDVPRVCEQYATGQDRQLADRTDSRFIHTLIFMQSDTRYRSLCEVYG